MVAAALSIATAKATGSNMWSSGGTTEVGSGDCFATAAAKVKIRHGPFAVYTEAWFNSEGGKQPVREATMKCARREGEGENYCCR